MSQIRKGMKWLNPVETLHCNRPTCSLAARKSPAASERGIYPAGPSAWLARTGKNCRRFAIRLSCGINSALLGCGFAALCAPCLVLLTLNAAEISPIPEMVIPAIPDRQDFQVPDRVQLTGWVGQRIQVNEANRLVKLDAERLLEGYRKRPGRQSWDGEHVGKWLHAATLAWANTGDPALREKLDYVAAELVKCQMEDGYLGTYVEKNRWTVMGCLGAQIQSDWADHLCALHRQHGAAGPPAAAWRICCATPLATSPASATSSSPARKSAWRPPACSSRWCCSIA